MGNIFIGLFLVGLLGLLIGLIKPTWIKLDSRKRVAQILGGVTILLFILVGFTTEPAPKVAPVVENVATSTDVSTVSAPSESVTQAKQAEPVKSAEVSSSAVPAKTSQYTYYSVTDVVDGDTIKVNINGTVTTLRLIGMDTPETVDPRKPVQCFGKEASNQAKSLLSGQKVRLEYDSSQGTLDKYGRTLAYVYREDGMFYNKFMIANGYAHEYTYNTPYKYQKEFKAAEQSARTSQLGLWSPNTCNGDTTSSASSSSSTNSTPTNTTGKFYTSSYYSSKYWYPETCNAWQTLSASYLKSFDSLDALLAAYPSRTKSPQCQ